MSRYLVHAPYEGDLVKGYRGAQTLLDDANENIGAFPPSLGHVHFGICFATDQHISLLSHPKRHVGVDVQLGNDRNFGPNQLSDGREDMAFTVRDPFRDHRAVKFKENAVDFSSGFDAMQQVVQDGIEVAPGKGSARMGFPKGGRYELSPVCGGTLDKATDRCVGAPILFQNFLTVLVAPSLFGAGDGRGHGRERACFVADATCRDSHIRPIRGQ